MRVPREVVVDSNSALDLDFFICLSTYNIKHARLTRGHRRFTPKTAISCRAKKSNDCTVVLKSGREIASA